MKPRRARKKRKASGRKDQYAFYVYCVGERQKLAPLLKDKLPDAIEFDSQLSLVAGDDLAAVVSVVPLADYRQDALQALLADPSWTAIRAMRHQNVVQHFASRSTVVPLRFGAIYLGQHGVEQMLSRKGKQLRSILKRLRGREEWGVNIYQDPGRLMEGLGSSSQRLRELTERAASASPGHAYLVGKKMEALRADESRAELRRVITDIERELKAVSDGGTRLRILTDEATEQGAVAAKFAFLVARRRFAGFRAAAQRLAKKYAPSGFQLELTGPWPAFNFTGK